MRCHDVVLREIAVRGSLLAEGSSAADRFGFEVLFGLTAVVALAAMVWLLTMVPEPRNLAPLALPDNGGGSTPGQT
jgi:hypothetical protein